MKQYIFKIIMIGALIFYPSCILSPPDLTLTGTWNCTILSMAGPSKAVMRLKETNGRVSGSFKWHDLYLPIDGTVNSKRQVNMETQDSTHRCIFALATHDWADRYFLDGTFQYYLNTGTVSKWMDGGSIEVERM